ncbi:MAG: hypothetical protein FWC11_04660 [Firmicutes bacterium]|nr:hypothetical protein [Bacillota bacterium]
MENLENKKTLHEKLFDKNDASNIVLFDAEDNAIELEQIGLVPFGDEFFAILRPLDEDEGAFVFVLDKDCKKSIHYVEDEKLANEILDLFNKN